jgi:hypothetical protein
MRGDAVPDGYGTRTGELAAVTTKIKNQVTPIDDQADKLTQGQVTAADFGRVFHDKGTTYTTAVHDNLVGSVRAYATATSTLGDRLHDAYQEYSQTEGANTKAMRGQS